MKLALDLFFVALGVAAYVLRPILVGVVLAAVAVAAMAGERPNSERAERQRLAADLAELSRMVEEVGKQSREVGRLELPNASGAVFALHSEGGQYCSGAWKRATYQQAKPWKGRDGRLLTFVEGCWREYAGDDGEMVRLVFIDGDEYSIPRKAFKDGSV